MTRIHRYAARASLAYAIGMFVLFDRLIEAGDDALADMGDS